MPTLICPDLGPFDFVEEDILTFPEGIPAFEGLHRFLLARKDEFAPFTFLVSVDSPATRFICVPIRLLEPDYHFELAANEGTAAGLEAGVYPACVDDPLVLAIVTLRGTAPATANLASPVVINANRQLGAQLILPEMAYSHVTPLRPFANMEKSC
jgi:flagellar assembly factor FliW